MACLRETRINLPSKPTNKMRYLFLLPIILIHSTTWPQTKPTDTNRDFGSWSSAQISYKFNKRWTFSLEEQYRLKDNLTAFDRLLTQLETEYNLSKQFEFGLGLRHLWLNDNLGNQQGLGIISDFIWMPAIKPKSTGFLFETGCAINNRISLVDHGWKGTTPIVITAGKVRLSTTLETGS